MHSENKKVFASGHSWNSLSAITQASLMHGESSLSSHSPWPFTHSRYDSMLPTVNDRWYPWAYFLTSERRASYSGPSPSTRKNSSTSMNGIPECFDSSQETSSDRIRINISWTSRGELVPYCKVGQKVKGFECQKSVWALHRCLGPYKQCDLRSLHLE